MKPRKSLKEKNDETIAGMIEHYSRLLSEDMADPQSPEDHIKYYAKQLFHYARLSIET